MSAPLQEAGSVMGHPALVDPLRHTIRVMLVLGAYEDAVYLVRAVDDTLERDGFTLSVDREVLAAKEGSKFPRLACQQVKAAYCAGRGGTFALSAGQHRALVRSGNFMEAMQAIARGLFPEEVIQRAIGAEVRLHVNGVR